MPIKSSPLYKVNLGREVSEQVNIPKILQAISVEGDEIVFNSKRFNFYIANGNFTINKAFNKELRSMGIKGHGLNAIYTCVEQMASVHTVVPQRSFRPL